LAENFLSYSSLKIPKDEYDIIASALEKGDKVEIVSVSGNELKIVILARGKVEKFHTEMKVGHYDL
ncbi:MAG TPA: hypothetical protein PLK94_03885, partial [Alphaproteobacteria bacterium]|nr:hypothetical protein [Alphaproteobacteria bacterium]